MLDSTVVALALPAIRGDVGASSEGLQWVMNGYLLTIAVLVVTAGRLGDMFGRKRDPARDLVVTTDDPGHWQRLKDRIPLPQRPSRS